MQKFQKTKLKLICFAVRDSNNERILSESGQYHFAVVPMYYKQQVENETKDQLVVCEVFEDEIVQIYDYLNEGKVGGDFSEEYEWADLSIDPSEYWTGSATNKIFPPSNASRLVLAEIRHVNFSTTGFSTVISNAAQYIEPGNEVMSLSIPPYGSGKIEVTLLHPDSIPEESISYEFSTLKNPVRKVYGEVITQRDFFDRSGFKLSEIIGLERISTDDIVKSAATESGNVSMNISYYMFCEPKLTPTVTWINLDTYLGSRITFDGFSRHSGRSSLEIHPAKRFSRQPGIESDNPAMVHFYDGVRLDAKDIAVLELESKYDEEIDSIWYSFMVRLDEDSERVIAAYDNTSELDIGASIIRREVSPLWVLPSQIRSGQNLNIRVYINGKPLGENNWPLEEWVHCFVEFDDPPEDQKIVFGGSEYMSFDHFSYGSREITAEDAYRATMNAPNSFVFGAKSWESKTVYGDFSITIGSNRQVMNTLGLDKEKVTNIDARSCFVAWAVDRQEGIEHNPTYVSVAKMNIPNKSEWRGFSSLAPTIEDKWERGVPWNNSSKEAFLPGIDWSEGVTPKNNKFGQTFLIGEVTKETNRWWTQKKNHFYQELNKWIVLSRLPISLEEFKIIKNETASASLIEKRTRYQTRLVADGIGVIDDGIINYSWHGYDEVVTWGGYQAEDQYITWGSGIKDWFGNTTEEGGAVEIKFSSGIHTSHTTDMTIHETASHLVGTKYPESASIAFSYDENQWADVNKRVGLQIEIAPKNTGSLYVVDSPSYVASTSTYDVNGATLTIYKGDDENIEQVSASLSVSETASVNFSNSYAEKEYVPKSLLGANVISGTDTKLHAPENSKITAIGKGIGFRDNASITFSAGVGGEIILEDGLYFGKSDVHPLMVKAMVGLMEIIPRSFANVYPGQINGRDNKRPPTVDGRPIAVDGTNIDDGNLYTILDMSDGKYYDYRYFNADSILLNERLAPENYVFRINEGSLAGYYLGSRDDNDSYKLRKVPVIAR